jgi:N utilization substance protein A
MEVVVPDEHLSLAIGRRGQNVRLAAQLTGWKVDIRSEAKMRELAQESRSLIAKIPDLGDIRAEILVNEGYKDPTDIARMDVRNLIRILRLTPEEAETVIRGAAELAERIESEKKKNLDDDWADLGLDTPFEEWEAAAAETNAHDAEAAALEGLVSKKALPLIDPDKISANSISKERQRYWMTLRGVGEQTAAVLETAQFQNYATLGSVDVPEIAHRTGLPLRLCGKLHVEASKNAGL